MAQFSAAPAAWTTAAFADSGSLTNSNHVTLRSWSVTVVDRVIEVYIAGQATSSTVLAMAIRRDSTQGATPTNVALAPLSPFSAAAAGNFSQLHTTPPVVGAATQHLINPGLNAFGGVVRWVAAPGEELYIIGATAANNELSLSAQTGAALIQTHMIVEEL